MDSDDDDFEDVLGEADLLQDSSQVSLTDAAADLSFADSHDERLDNSRLARSTDDGEDIGGRGGNFENGEVTDGVSDGDLQSGANLAVIAKIEDVFENIVDALLNEKDEFSITLKSRKRSSQTTNAEAETEAPPRRICFPGKSAEEAWRFSMILRILELMHEALRNNVVLSKRDIYYRDPALFGKQTHVDRYVDDIAYTFGVSRSSLNVTAAAKGLLAGAITVCRRDGSVLDASTDREGILVPNTKDLLSVDMTAVKWILVIEKEATFRSIAASDFWDIITTQGVIITAKGYPDLASRAMLRLLSCASPQNGFTTPPVFGLADYDPDGMAILSTYRDGSKALAHENEEHCVPQLQWLGLRSEHLLLSYATHAAQGILTLTARDRTKAIKLVSDLFDGFQRRELQTMLMLNMKAELQLLDAVPGAMGDLLTAELHRL